jgi:ABC-type nitrate/sulfonate/bicarbonate transport system substrate-binding protein
MKRNNKVIGLLLVAAMLMLFFMAGAAAAEDEVVGMVAQTDSGTVLVVGKEKLMVTGADLADLMGKKVKAKGTITKTAKGSVIEVAEVEEVKK